MTSAARDAGAAHLKAYPEMLLCDAMRAAATAFDNRESHDEFVAGFKRERELRDEFIRERARA